jgi:hypothetical protein
MFISDRMSYVILRGRWCNIIILNMHVHVRISDDVKDSFYEELGRVFHQFPMYDMNILLGDFNTKVVRNMFPNRQSGTRVHTKLIITMDLE